MRGDSVRRPGMKPRAARPESGALLPEELNSLAPRRLHAPQAGRGGVEPHDELCVRSSRIAFSPPVCSGPTHWKRCRNGVNYVSWFRG